MQYLKKLGRRYLTSCNESDPKKATLKAIRSKIGYDSDLSKTASDEKTINKIIELELTNQQILARLKHQSASLLARAN